MFSPKSATCQKSDGQNMPPGSHQPYQRIYELHCQYVLSLMEKNKLVNERNMKIMILSEKVGYPKSLLFVEIDSFKFFWNKFICKDVPCHFLINIMQ